MRALIYTNNDAEYDQIKEVFADVSQLIEVKRDPMDGHGHYEDPFDIIVIALDGARGMNEVNEWTGRFPASKVIWITDDKDFAGVAIQKHIFDFIVRPLDDIRLKECLRETVSDRSGSNSWHIPSQV